MNDGLIAILGKILRPQSELVYTHSIEGVYYYLPDRYQNQEADENKYDVVYNIEYMNLFLRFTISCLCHV